MQGLQEARRDALLGLDLQAIICNGWRKQQFSAVKGRSSGLSGCGGLLENALLPSVHNGFGSLCDGRSLGGTPFVHHCSSVEEEELITV